MESLAVNFQVHVEFSPEIQGQNLFVNEYRCRIYSIGDYENGETAHNRVLCAIDFFNFLLESARSSY